MTHPHETCARNLHQNLIWKIVLFGLSFRPVLIRGPYWTCLWAVVNFAVGFLDISKIYGPFWFMGHFGIDPKKLA